MLKLTVYYLFLVHTVESRHNGHLGVKEKKEKWSDRCCLLGEGEKGSGFVNAYCRIEIRNAIKMYP